MVEYYIEALNSDTRWGSGTTQTTITYTFNATSGHYSNGSATNYQLFNADQQVATRLVLESYSAIANVTFVELNTTNPFAADIVFRQATMPTNVAGWAYYPSIIGSDVTIDKRYDALNNSPNDGLNKGYFGYRLLMHEIGHAMGLAHPHEGNTPLPTTEDTQNASVMSYFNSSLASVGGNVATRSGPTAPHTLQLYDIATIQEIYGVNQTYLSDDTTHFLGSSTEYQVSTIWDGGGVDWLSAEGFLGNATLDLREGLEYVSHAGLHARWLAFGSNIERAMGGEGNDTIYGNDLKNKLNGGGGNDTIYGGNAQDILTGGEGADIFLFSSLGDSTKLQYDKITDFAVGADKIMLDGLGFTGLDKDGGLTEAGDLRMSFSDATNRTYILSDQENFQFFLDGDYTATLSDDDFIFDVLPQFSGDAGNNILIGSESSELLYGLAGDDYLQGKGGDDVIDGGAGQDKLVGGAGQDIFVFSNVADSQLNNNRYDRIVDFEVGEDIIDVSALGLESLTLTSANADDALYLTYSVATHRTYLMVASDNFAFFLDGDFSTLLSDNDFYWS